MLRRFIRAITSLATSTLEGKLCEKNAHFPGIIHAQASQLKSEIRSEKVSD